MDNPLNITNELVDKSPDYLAGYKHGADDVIITSVRELKYTIERVRNLHDKVWRYRDCDCCPNYGDYYCCECDQLYPCDTIQELDGED